jgi:hypothetical protein
VLLLNAATFIVCAVAYTPYGAFTLRISRAFLKWQQAHLEESP